MARYRRLSEISQQRQTYLWLGRVPFGGVSLFEGDPGDGKTSVLLDLAARLTSGRSMPFSSKAQQSAGVVLVSAEDHVAATIRPAMEAAGADLGRVAVFDKSESFKLPDDMVKLEEAVAEVKARLIVVDPLAACLSGSMSNDQSVRRALGPLVALAERRNLAVVLIRHLTKARGKRSVAMGAGSVGIIGLARSALIVLSPPNNSNRFEHCIAVGKSNLATAKTAYYRTLRHESGAIGVEWLRETEQLASELLNSEEERVGTDEQFDAGYVLHALLSEGPVLARRVISMAKTRAGISERTLKRVKQRLGIRSRKIGSGRGSFWVWELPQDRRGLSVYKDRELSDLCDQLVYGLDGGDDQDIGDNGTRPTDDDQAGGLMSGD